MMCVLYSNCSSPSPVLCLYTTDEAPKPNANMDPFKAKEMMDKLRAKMARQQEIVKYMVENVELLGSINLDMRKKASLMAQAGDAKIQVRHVYDLQRDLSSRRFHVYCFKQPPSKGIDHLCIWRVAGKNSLVCMC